MRPDPRVVVVTPLTELWDASGVLPAVRGRQLGAEDVVDLLRRGPVRFVVADPGLPLAWRTEADATAFWTTEVRPHLVAPSNAGFFLDELPGGYGYVATAWHAEGSPIVLLERHH